MTTLSPIRPTDGTSAQEPESRRPSGWRERLGRVLSAVADFVVAMRDSEARDMPRTGKVPPLPRS